MVSRVQSMRYMIRSGRWRSVVQDYAKESLANNAEESDETLTSESESGQAGLGVDERKSRPNVHRVHYEGPIVILDDEPEVNSKGLATSEPIGLQVESSRSTGNLAAHHRSVTGFSTGKADSGALVSSLNLEPNTDTYQDNGLNSMKRKGLED
ncbi:hypothetical protein ANO14919_079370 [Xylariales sp. No.14919]|nr:hypothetical protein ANO14919_079370 [Xylariales sp. No.14919]